MAAVARMLVMDGGGRWRAVRHGMAAAALMLVSALCCVVVVVHSMHPFLAAPAAQS
ncbi:MAG: hypothetical protein V9H69_20700 [Anaerolineae bacterium]